MTFTGTLGVRVGLLDFKNYELVKIGLYRVQVSCWLDTGIHGKPVSLQAAPLSTTAVANGVCCGASPYPSLVAEVDDQDHFSLSRTLHVRYTDERHQLQEATVFHLQGVPMLPADDSRLFLRLRLLHAELPQDGVELASTHFAPVSSRTLCLSAVAAGAGQSFFSPMLFDRDHLACVGVTVHAGLVGSAFVPPALPPALTLSELAASAEELRAALPARGAADGPSQPQPQPRPPAWARKYFKHAAAQLSLLEAISPAAHRAGQLAREAAVSALLAHATAAALGSAAAPSESAALSQAAGHFNAGLLAACSASAALEAQLEGVGQGAGSGQAPGGHFEAQPEPLAAAQRALVEAVQAVEGRVREWCQLPPESALPGAAGAGAVAGAALALAEVALDASGLHSKAQRQQQQGQQQQHSAAQAATHLAEQAAQASHSLGRAWKAACQALLAAPGARFLPPLQQGFQAAAAAALAACCSRQQAPLAGLTQPLAAELQHPARRSAAGSAGSAAAVAALAHEPAVDTARHYIHASWEHYSQPPPPPPAAAAAAPSGHHLVVFVHGLGGNVHDMRGYKAALKAHHPSLLCYTASSLAGSSGGDILANGLRLAQEIAGLCAPGGLAAGSSGSGLAAASLSSARPARLSIVAFSLGGVWARAALRAPALAPHLPLLHAFVSIASPHAGFPPDAKGSSLLQTGAFFARAFTKQHNTLALQQLAMQAGAEAAAAAVGPRSSSSSAPHPPSAAATAAAQPLLYYLACGWQQQESSASSSEAAAEPLASLLREGLASGPNGQAVFARCRHVALLASPQDTYSPLHSALACELGGSGSGSGSGSESRHATMVRGLWAGCAGGGAGGAAAAAWGGSAARVSVQLREVGGGGAQQAALAEGATGPRDSACAQAPPATLLAALGTGLAGVLDSVSGRDAHMAMLTSEALPLLVALGLAEAWRE